MSVSKYAGVFLAGVACGTMSEKVLANPSVRKALVNVAATGLKVKDDVIEKAVALQESAEDILAEAKALNEAKDAAAGDPAAIGVLAEN